MKTLYGYSAAVILFCLAFFQAEASHLMGSDIVYRCLGNGQYEVTVKVYRNCGGVSLSNTPIFVEPLNCAGSSFSQMLDQISVTDITPVCSSVQSLCVGGIYPYGIEEYVYTGTIDLSTYTSCCKFRISWQLQARNTDIGTGQAGQNFYTDAILDKCVIPCNSSPQITNRPIAIICQGQDFCFNNGILDSVDGDSLSYTMADALIGPNTPASYSGSYSKIAPMHFLGFPNNAANWPAGFRLDPKTGDLCFRPTMLQLAVLVIQVIEWRKINGTMTNIGETRRDMQVIVTPCPNNKVPNVLGPYAYDACANVPICFDMQSTDLDIKDTVRLTWNKGIPGGTFTTAFGSGTSAKKQKGTFCWTPTDDDVSTNPYYFTVTAKDDACPINANTTKAYSITVNPIPRGVRTIVKKKCGIVDFAITPLANYGTLIYQWRIKKGASIVASSANSSFTHKFTGAGEYVVQSTLRTAKNCSMDYFDTVVVDTFAIVTLPADTFVCFGNSMPMLATPMSGVMPYRFAWSTGANDTIPTVTVKPSAYNMYKVTITDNEGCENSDSMYIEVKDLPYVYIGPDQRICSGESVILDAGGPDLTYLWSQSETTQQITISDSGRYSVRVTDTFQCINYDTMELRVNKPVVISPLSDVAICLGDSITLTGNGGDFYTWTNLSNNISAIGNSISVSPAYTILYELLAQRTYKGVTCGSLDTVRVTVNYSTPISFPLIPDRCEDYGNIALTATPANGFGGTGAWSCPGCPPNSVTGSTFKTPVAKKGTHMVRYTFTNSLGCISRDSTPVMVNPMAVLNPGPVRKACLNAGPQKLVGTTSIPGGITNWSCTNCPSPNVVSKNMSDTFFFDPGLAGLGNFNLEYKFTTDMGCITTVNVTFQVLVLPAVDAGSLNKVCLNDNPLDLDANSSASPAGGTWVGSGVSGALFSPAVAGAGTHKLYYTYAIAGCSKTDSVNILVNELPVVDAGQDADLCYYAGSPLFLLTGTADGNINPAGSNWYCSNCPAGSDPVNAAYEFDPAILGTDAIKTFDLVYEYTNPVTACVNSDIMKITVRRLPTVSIPDPGLPLCEFDTFHVAAVYTGTNGITWSSPDPASIFGCSTCPETFFKAAPGLLNTTITVKANDIPACPVVEETVSMKIWPAPTAFIVPDNDSGCIPLSVSFTAVTNAAPGATYSWQFGDPNSVPSTAASPFHMYTEAGIWNATLRILSVDGCYSQPAVYPIAAHPLPVAAFTYNPEYVTVALPRFAFINKSIGASNYEWSFGDSKNNWSTEVSPVFMYPPDTATYTVDLKAITQFGCRDSVSAIVKVNPGVLVFIPNAFTPDQTGPERNNKFYVEADGITDYHLVVFNRWGAILFRSSDKREGWDGTFNHKPCQDGVYVYTLDVISFEGKPLTYSGTLTLLR